MERAAYFKKSARAVKSWVVSKIAYIAGDTTLIGRHHTH
ncbi:hypothetical protein ADIMK_3153 [Marinobacterium lacunae]|uniref:Uncharacterized protein n=1 Tax=Marinobacterium lacunae TaxID=1232683 RepID=A0A081FVX6_9GAMM|nr:hypothetical protein ADIMK_3153 [Marinobacterium lacunae]